ncbi:MAG: RHS repeat-associated core domain-containing protein [bacterium]|nr:RHS repeat-associated core domain-containing protein [bacterium]
MVASYRYDPFGNITNQTGTITNPFGFTGRELDRESGLYFNRARYYDPEIGRFISEDLVRDYEEGNLYSYCKNDPVNCHDPWGLKNCGRCGKSLGNFLGIGKKCTCYKCTGCNKWVTNGYFNHRCRNPHRPSAEEMRKLDERINEACKTTKERHGRPVRWAVQMDPDKFEEAKEALFDVALAVVKGVINGVTLPKKIAEELAELAAKGAKEAILDYLKDQLGDKVKEAVGDALGTEELIEELKKRLKKKAIEFCAGAPANPGCGSNHRQNRRNICNRAGGDRPDDTVDVSTVNGVPIHPSGYAPCAILMNGYFDHIALLLEKLGEPYAIHDTTLPSGTADDHSILFIGSGGLYGLDGSAQFREALARYADEGGTIVCFSQQMGYDFTALPTSEVGGYGWREDQSCWSNAVYVETAHPIFAGQTGLYLTANCDGYFTQWPGSTTILLMRTKNKLPAMIMYPYGKGRVIATSLYSDQGFIYSQASANELALIQDIITWAKDPEGTIPEFSPGSSTNLSVTLLNYSTQTASNVKIKILNPDKSFSSLLPTPYSLLSNSMSTHTFTHTAGNTLGLYTICYTLLDASNNPIQQEIAAERFAVAKPDLGPKPQPGLSYSIGAPGHELVAESKADFVINLYNKSNEGGTVNISWDITHSHRTLLAPIYVASNSSTAITVTDVPISGRHSIWRFWVWTNICPLRLYHQIRHLHCPLQYNGWNLCGQGRRLCEWQAGKGCYLFL